jgi:hypothetical protein
MTQTASYKERKKFVIYDERHALLYLNEQPVEITDEETGESSPGFSYTGNMPDGGTLVEAEGVNETNLRDKFVAGLIGVSYDMDAQIAVLANGTDTPEHAAELAAFASTRTECKRQVDEMLARNL